MMPAHGYMASALYMTWSCFDAAIDSTAPGLKEFIAGLLAAKAGIMPVMIDIQAPRLYILTLRF